MKMRKARANTPDQRPPYRPNATAAPAGEILSRQEPGTEQQRKERAPYAAVESDVTARRLAQHAAHRGQR